MHMPVPRLATTLIGALTALVLLAGPAAAHSELTSSDPAQDSVVATAPQQVTLTFSDQVKDFEPQATVQVGNGEPAAAPVKVDGNKLIVTTGDIPAASGPARWQVAFRIVSADGHPISGAVSFQVGEGTVADAPAKDSAKAPAKEDGPGAGLWAIIGGIAAVIALGAVFLWRRSQAAENLAKPEDTPPTDQPTN